MLEDDAEAPRVPKDIQDREGPYSAMKNRLDRWVTMNGAGVSGPEKAHPLVRCSI